MSGIAGLSLSRSVVQRLAHAFDDVLGGDDAAGQIHLGRRQVNHLAFFTAVVFFSAVPVRFSAVLPRLAVRSRRLYR